ncbi:MAG: hypothetical protein GY850_32190, partial [bacterium]|nr:hypothetical protein [bacterium]
MCRQKQNRPNKIILPILKKSPAVNTLICRAFLFFISGGSSWSAYKPNEGLSVTESEKFHSWQIDELAQAGVDFLIAETLPSVEEAKGIARAMEL